jgi:5-methyltetrahydropteroyltriglutamate--homocysteine methyltransferase
MILTGMGSYPRIGDTTEQQRLRRAIHRLDRGEIDRDDLYAVADDVTAEVIRDQVQVGLDWVTDGCIRWEDMVSHVANKLPNVRRGGLLRHFDSNTYVRQPVVTGPIGWERPVVAAESAFAVAESPKPVKAVVTGPYTVAKYSDDQHYGALEPLVMDYAAALNNEVKAVMATGVSCVQIDEPSILQEPGDWLLFERAMARLMDGVPGTTAIATYFGDAVPLVSQLLSLPFTIVYFDCSYAPLVVDALRGKGEGRHIGVSVVDARNTKLESLADVQGNVQMAQDIVGSHNLHITPSAGLEFLPRKRAYEKLERMIAGATVGSGR